MSPLFRDDVAIYLARRKVALVRRGRGMRERILAAAEVTVPAGAAGDFAPALGRLAQVLTEHAWCDAAARVMVANPLWARFAVVPWVATRLDDKARLAQARFVLADLYGDLVADWTVTLSDTPPGQPYVACAMPPTLRGAIEEVLAPAGLELVSLQPKLTAAFNGWRRRLPVEDSWFVSLDEESLAAVHLKDGAWDRVHTARLSADWTLELERLEAFGRLTRAAGSRGPMFVDAPVAMRAASPSAAIEWLREPRDDDQTHELNLLRRMYA